MEIDYIRLYTRLRRIDNEQNCGAGATRFIVLLVCYEYEII